jgi:hypothetical protein
VFIQVIRARVTDAEGLRERLDRWVSELAPGADGWLGSTGGITDEGHLVLGARFASPEAARRNSARPEQDTWWQATCRHLDDVLFHDCPQVDVYKGGGSDDAGFVQVIQGRVTDKDAYRAEIARLDREGEPQARASVIGGVVAWDGNHFTEFVYFTSERQARQEELAPGHSIALEQRWSVSQDPSYFDLRQPWLVSPGA